MGLAEHGHVGWSRVVLKGHAFRRAATNRYFGSAEASVKPTSSISPGDNDYGIIAATFGGLPELLLGAVFGLGVELDGELITAFLSGVGKRNCTPRSSFALTVAGISSSVSAIFFRP